MHEYWEQTVLGFPSAVASSGRVQGNGLGDFDAIDRGRKYAAGIACAFSRGIEALDVQAL